DERLKSRKEKEKENRKEERAESGYSSSCACGTGESTNTASMFTRSLNVATTRRGCLLAQPVSMAFHCTSGIGAMAGSSTSKSLRSPASQRTPTASTQCMYRSVEKQTRHSFPSSSASNVRSTTRERNSLE